MRLEPRRPTYALDGRQIGWEIRIVTMLDEGRTLPANPHDCPWFCADGQPHACVQEEGEDFSFCDALVSGSPGQVICVYGFFDLKTGRRL